MTAPTWAEIAKVLEALAAVLWPAVVAFAILKFHKDVRALIAGLKLKRGKILGQEFELGELDRLEKETRALQSSEPVGVDTTRAGLAVDVFERLLRESPKVALMWLQAEIERRLRLALRNRGIKDADHVPFQRAMDSFGHNEVPKDFGRWLTEFRAIRNSIIHGHDATDDDALRAIDIGLRILPVINRISDSPLDK